MPREWTGSGWRQPVAEERPFRSIVEVSTTGEILTLEQAQFELGIDPQAALLATPRQTREDTKVNDSIREARQWCEFQVSRTLRATVQRYMTLDALPVSRFIEFVDPPLISVDTVEYRDEAGDYQTVDSGDYRVLIPTEGKGILQFTDDFVRPDLMTGAVDVVKVTYTSGYATEAGIPDLAKSAAKLLLSLFYDYDESPQNQQIYFDRAKALLQPLEWGSYE